MTHWFLQTNQIARGGTHQCDSEETSSLSSYIVVHPATSFFNLASVTITCVKWAPRPASGAWALAGPDTCLRSAVPATLDRMWLINRPVLITGTPLTWVAVTWIPRWGDSKLQGKCNGFCYIATHWDSELHQRPDVITCPQDASSVFYDDYSENQVSAQIVMVFASVAPVLSIMSIQRGDKGIRQVVHFTCQPTFERFRQVASDMKPLSAFLSVWGDNKLHHERDAKAKWLIRSPCCEIWWRKRSGAWCIKTQWIHDSECVYAERQKYAYAFFSSDFKAVCMDLFL